MAFGKAIIVFILFLVGALNGYCLDPDKIVDKYIQRHWGARDGLPHNTVTAITQDKTGFIWLGTENGFAWFDGNVFETYNTINTKELKHNSIKTLLVSSDNRLWIGTKCGLLVYNIEKEQFDNFSSHKNFPTGAVDSIVEDKGGYIWVGVDGGGLARIRRLNFNVFTTKDGLSDERINCIYLGWNGNLWIGTETGLNCFNNGKFLVYTKKDGLADNRVYALHEDRGKNLWVGTAKGICRVKMIETKVGGKIESISSPSGVGERPVHSILEDKDNVVWVALDDGLKRFIPIQSKTDGGYRVETISQLEGMLLKTPALALYQDRTNALWIGTEWSGVERLQNTDFKYYTTSDGLSHNYVISIYEDEKENVWIGTRDGGLNRLNNGEFTVYKEKDGLSCNNITAISQDGEGKLWVGTSVGLNRYDPPRFTNIAIANDSSNEAVSMLYTDMDKTMWIGLDGGGLKAYKNGSVYTPFTPVVSNDFAKKTALSAVQTVSRDLWIGTQEGLYCLRGNRFVWFRGKERLSKYIIQDIFYDNSGILWFGTNFGLLYYDIETGQVVTYPWESKFTNANIYKVFDDKRNNLWMSSSEGLFCIQKEYFFMIYKGNRMDPFKYYHLTESDGLKTSIFTGGTQHAGYKTKEGKLWFPSVDGAVVVDTLDVKLRDVSIPVVIEKIKVDGIKFETVQGVRSLFPSESRKIEIYFSALNFSGLENLKFKYRLQSNISPKFFDREEIVDQTHKKVVFYDLRQGSYRFSVTAGNEDKGWSVNAASFGFTIGGGLPWTETFVIFLVISLAVVLVVVSRILDHRKKEKEIMRIFGDDLRYKTSAMDSKKMKKHMIQILTLMEKEKLYLDPEMSVSKMAHKLGIPKEHISQVINLRFYMNFNQFLNKYRVEEAKKRLMDPAENRYVVLKIGYDVGFNSKSTFNSSFKKFTGMSPSEYREKYQGGLCPQPV